jgi:hypothetical protein
MSTQIQRRRGTTSGHSTFIGASGEITVDTTKNTLVVHDGTTAGGFPLAKESDALTSSAIGVTVPSQLLMLLTILLTSLSQVHLLVSFYSGMVQHGLTQ